MPAMATVPVLLDTAVNCNTSPSGSLAPDKTGTLIKV